MQCNTLFLIIRKTEKQHFLSIPFFIHTFCDWNGKFKWRNKERKEKRKKFNKTLSYDTQQRYIHLILVRSSLLTQYYFHYYIYPSMYFVSIAWWEEAKSWQ
jgi:hypothetical protein